MQKKKKKKKKKKSDVKKAEPLEIPPVLLSTFDDTDQS